MAMGSTSKRPVVTLPLLSENQERVLKVLLDHHVRWVDPKEIYLGMDGMSPFWRSKRPVLFSHGKEVTLLDILMRNFAPGPMNLKKVPLNPDGTLRVEAFEDAEESVFEENVGDGSMTASDTFRVGVGVGTGGDKFSEVSYATSQPHCGVAAFRLGLPMNIQRLQQLYTTGEFSDVEVNIEGHGLIARSHKVILGLWSLPFMKMFTNGTSESVSSEVCLKDVSPKAFKIMIDYFYNNGLNLEDTVDTNILLLELLLLADQFGVSLLHQDCCKTLLEQLTEWLSVLH